MLLCKSAIAAESLMHLLGTHLNRSVQGVTVGTAQAEGAFIFAPRLCVWRCLPGTSSRERASLQAPRARARNGQTWQARRANEATVARGS